MSQNFLVSELLGRFACKLVKYLLYLSSLDDAAMTHDGAFGGSEAAPSILC